MASKLAVCTAGFIHIVLGLSLFLSQEADACSPAPQLASYIFAGAVLVAAVRITLYSKRYIHLPYFIQFLVETIGTLAILEFSNLYFWCRLERIIHHVVRLSFFSLGMGAEKYLKQEYWLLVVPTTALAASFLVLATRGVSLFRKQPMIININRNRRHTDMVAHLEILKNYRNRPLNPRNYINH